VLAGVGFARVHTDQRMVGAVYARVRTDQRMGGCCQRVRTRAKVVANMLAPYGPMHFRKNRSPADPSIFEMGLGGSGVPVYVVRGGRALRMCVCD